MTQLSALVLTLAAEIPVALAVAAAIGVRDRSRLVRLGLVVAAASLLTHPLAWWASVDGLRGLPWSTRAAVIEGAVAIAETAIVAWRVPLSIGRAFVVAGVANFASFALGAWVI